MNRRLLMLPFVFFITLPLLAQPSTPDTTQWIAVVAPDLLPPLTPLVEHRRAEGYHVVVLDVGQSAAATEGQIDADSLRDLVRQSWESWDGPSTVLLVGAPLADPPDVPTGAVVPALTGSVARMKTQLTDNPYGCRAGEHMPRVAVGRFPARSAAELAGMARKTLDWERQELPGVWKRRFVLLAGAPSYNPLVDGMVERLAMSHFEQLDPSWFGNVIYHNPNSCYNVPDPLLRQQALDYLKDGQLLTIFLGHSNPEGFWYTGWSPLFFTATHWSTLKLPPARGVFVSFGCRGAQYVGPEGEGYAVHAARNPDGPVAVVGSHGNCWAAMAMLFSEGLLQSLPSAERPVRLGELWLGMNRHLASGPLAPMLFSALNAVDGSTETSEAEQRLEHLEMFLLLGDPALRLPALTHTIALEAPTEAGPGDTIYVSAKLPPALTQATGWLRLERPITSFSADLEPPPADAVGSARDQWVQANHRAANRFVLEEIPVTTERGELRATVRLPQQLLWKQVLIRAYVSTPPAEACAVHSIRVRSRQ